MSIQRKTLQLVQGNLKGTRLCKDVLVVLPTEHLLRGIVFERTLVKEMYYLWGMIMPLYRPANAIILNYSTRIADGEPVQLTRSRLSETAERIAASMCPGHLSYLRKVKGPREFLKHVNWMAGNGRSSDPMISSWRCLRGDESSLPRQFAEVPPEVTKMITCNNAGKLYGLIN